MDQQMAYQQEVSTIEWVSQLELLPLWEVVCDNQALSVHP